MSDLTVANTILQQLGGSKFLAMTGAKDLAGTDNSLSFKLPTRSTKNKANHVKIILTASDDYTVEYGQIKPGNFKKGIPPSFQILETVTGIYAENLQSSFTRVTGLHTRLF